jgi:hypothetical protein
MSAEITEARDSIVVHWHSSISRVLSPGTGMAMRNLRLFASEDTGVETIVVVTCPSIL